MLRRNGHRRAGITLVELLVVIAIIAVLMSLLLAGVMRAMDAGPTTDTTARIKGLEIAIGNFKGQYHVPYIPAGSVDITQGSPNYGQVVGPFRLRNSYPPPSAGVQPDEFSFEAQYIKQMFPQANLMSLDGSNPPNTNFGGPLDANQTLLFFLNGLSETNGAGYYFHGFSKNPRTPFAPGGENRHVPLLDLSDKHVRPGPGNYPWIVDGWGNPLAYFSAFNGKEPPSTGPLRYGGAVTNGAYVNSEGVAMGPVVPYTKGNPPKLVNPTSFQIISAGKNGLFGPGGDWGSVTKPGDDDRANFSTSELSSGPE